MFSDGAFSIVITLLLAGIQGPGTAAGSDAAALLRSWPFYTAYVLAFTHVGAIWLSHHTLFQRIRHADRPLMWMKLGILGTSALVPYPTAMLATAFESGDLADQRAAIVAYAAAAGLMSAAWLPIFPYLHRHRHLATTNLSDAEFRLQCLRPLVGMVSYVAAGLLGWYASPWVAMSIFAWMVAYHAWTSQDIARIGFADP